MDRRETESATTSSARRRILVLIKCMDRGGAEQLVASMVRHGDRNRFDYEVAYALKQYDALVPDLERAGVPVHSLGARGNYDLRWTARLRTLLARGDFDVVHSHLPYAASFGRLVAATFPTRRPSLVYTEHCMWDRTARPVRALNRATVGLDDRLLVVSEAARQSLPAHQRRRAQVIVHGIELEAIAEAQRRKEEHRQAVRAELRLTESERLALTVANFRWQKGHDVLLRSIRLLVDRGVPVRFAFVGHGPLRRDLERQRDALMLGDHVRFLGERDDVPRLLSAADLFVLPSRYEGLPLALMEAACSGLPVVTTSVSEIPRLLTNGEDALLVPPENSEALADAVTAVVRDAALRASLSAAVLGLRDRFDVRRCTREVEAIYDTLRPVARPARTVTAVP
jgi:glycosyltransferase involved in cell wall biosynthesis